MGKRRDYGSGTVYQRESDGRWIGSFEAGTTAKGTRRRPTVSGRTEAEAKRKLRDKKAAYERGEIGSSSRVTVKAWADTWLAMKVKTLSPNGYKAARSPVTQWIVPTIGHRRLDALTPADVRAVTTAIRSAGRSGSTAAGAQRTLFNMLRDAITEGHTVPQRVLFTKAPSVGKSDRLPLTIPETLAALSVAAELPHGTRWLFALLYGARKGECLGTTWDEGIDLRAGTFTVEWQLQPLNYLDPKDKSKGFRVPDDLEARHLYKAFHLTRPKSKAGLRVYPILPQLVEPLERWRAIAPENPWGLVWPNAAGKPASGADDLEEWHALQGTAGIGHPAGRYYHVHECRNVTATELRNAGTDETILTALLGHTDVRTSRGYIATDMAAKRIALEKVAGVLGIGAAASPGSP